MADETNPQSGKTPESKESETAQPAPGATPRRARTMVPGAATSEEPGTAAKSDPGEDTGAKAPQAREAPPAAAAVPAPSPPAEEAEWRGFAADEIESLRARWRQLQGDFVDDPTKAMREADNLVDETLRTLTKRLTEQHSALTGQWDAKGNDDTEQLRLTIRRYRTLLHRMLGTGE